MTTYVLAQLTIHGRDRYDRYSSQFIETLAPFEGHLIVADERPEVVTGGWDHDKVVLLGFPTRSHADRRASSDRYQRIAIDREASTTATVLVLVGLDDVAPCLWSAGRRPHSGPCALAPSWDDSRHRGTS